jgi:hypothetical protein
LAERVFWNAYSDGVIAISQGGKDVMTDRGKEMVTRSIYIALGVLAARWIFGRKPEPDLLARLRAAGV